MSDITFSQLIAWGAIEWTPAQQIELIDALAAADALPALDVLAPILCDEAARHAWDLATVEGEGIDLVGHYREMPRLIRRRQELQGEHKQ